MISFSFLLFLFFYVITMQTSSLSQRVYEDEMIRIYYIRKSVTLLDSFRLHRVPHGGIKPDRRHESASFASE